MKFKASFSLHCFFLDTFFYIGTEGARPIDPELQGFPIPDERGLDKPLSSYLNKTLVLSIPSDRPDIFSARWFSIWSIGLKRSLAHVPIPVEPNVPPSLDKLGIDPQVHAQKISFVFLSKISINNIVGYADKYLHICSFLSVNVEL